MGVFEYSKSSHFSLPKDKIKSNEQGGVVDDEREMDGQAKGSYRKYA